MSGNEDNGQPTLSFHEGAAKYILWMKDNEDDPSLSSTIADERKLALWREDVINAKKRNALDEEQKYLLDYIKFCFPVRKGDAFATTFQKNLVALKEWKEKNGEKLLLVPRPAKWKGEDDEDIDIGNFIHNARKMKRKKDAGENTFLTEGMIASLDKLDMVWENVSNAQWQLNYDELKAFIRKEGHPDVPQKQGKLGQWVSNQRKSYNKGSLSDYYISKLNEVNFKWSLRG
eukprot:scaffold26585_cov131-Skeletonema_menzelii.AAC.3